MLLNLLNLTSFHCYFRRYCWIELTSSFLWVLYPSSFWRHTYSLLGFHQDYSRLFTLSYQDDSLEISCWEEPPLKHLINLFNSYLWCYYQCGLSGRRPSLYSIIVWGLHCRYLIISCPHLMDPLILENLGITWSPGKQMALFARIIISLFHLISSAFVCHNRYYPHRDWESANGELKAFIYAFDQPL